MGEDDRKRAIDAFAWALNIFASVSIVMVNKQLMGGQGFGFTYATTLCGMHFLCTSFVGFCTGTNKKVEDTNAAGEKMRMPPMDVLLFVCVSACSIIGLNLSLMLNTIGFYQVCKLAQIPTMCVIEGTFFGKKFSRKVIQSIIIVLMGVGVATVSDVEMNTLGTVAAFVGVFATSAQQILVGYMQKKHNITSNFLLAKTSPYMAGSMLLLGPFLDYFITGKMVIEYEWNVPSLVCLGVSCGLAVLVNISQYLCIGRFSAVSFQVIGHCKTVLVFFFGWVCFAAPVTQRNIMGCLLAVCGMIYYSHATKAPSTPVSDAPAGAGEAGPSKA